MRKKNKNRKKKQQNKSLSFKNSFLFLFLSLLPTQLGKHFFFPFSYLSAIRVDYLAPTIYLIDIIALLIFIFNISVVSSFFKKRAVFLFICLLTLNVFFAYSKEIAFYRFIKIFELLGVFAVFSEVKLDKKILFYSIFAGTFFETVLVTLQFVYKKSLQGIFYFFGERYIDLSMPDIAKGSLNGIEILRGYGTFSHPNSLAGFYLLLYVFFLFFQNLGIKRVLKNLLLLLFTILVFLSFSKTAIVTFLLINVIYLIINRKKIECYICNFSRLFISFILGALFLTSKNDPLSFTKRLDLTKNAFTLIQHHLFFGVGLGNFLVAENKLALKFLYYTLQPVHNIFLLFLSESGLIITGVLSYLLVKEFINERRNLLFLGCFTIVVITGVSDHYWLTLEQNFLLIGVVFGLIKNSQFRV